MLNGRDSYRFQSLGIQNRTLGGLMSRRESNDWSQGYGQRFADPSLDTPALYRGKQDGNGILTTST